MCLFSAYSSKVSSSIASARSSSSRTSRAKRTAWALRRSICTLLSVFIASRSRQSACGPNWPPSFCVVLLRGTAPKNHREFSRFAVKLRRPEEYGLSRLSCCRNWRRGWESNPRVKVLQTSPLPLGYRALKNSGKWQVNSCKQENTLHPCLPLSTFHLPLVSNLLERETGFEPATSTLARSHSTTELFPLGPRWRSFQTALAFKV